MSTYIFFNVKHGLFSLYDSAYFRFIYDCGSNNKKVIENAVHNMEEIIGKFSKIDVVIISHYDKDHINGLSEILNKFEVKIIVLPMIHPLMKLSGICEDTPDFIKEFIIDPMDFIKNKSPNTKILTLLPSEENKIEDEKNTSTEKSSIGINSIKVQDIVWIDNKNEIKGIVEVVFSTISLIISNQYYLTKEQIEILLEKIDEKLNYESNEDAIISALAKKNCIIHGNINNIKGILESLLGKIMVKNLNNYSLLLVSKPKDPNCRNAFYTGDMKSEIVLTNPLGQHISQAQVIQLPHHGSIDSFKEQICSLNATHIISAKKPSEVKSKNEVNAQQVVDILSRNNYSYKCTWDYEDIIELN